MNRFLFLASVDWFGFLCFLLLTAAACVVWFYLLRGVFEAVRELFRKVRKHGN
jgi:hypothetical protein